MAFTGSPTGSAEYNRQIGVVPGSVALPDKVRLRQFSYTHAAGAGVGEINLMQLPEGQFTTFSAFSRIISSAMVATADLHLGFRAYWEPDGDAVLQDDNAFADNLDAGAAIDVIWPLPADNGRLQFNVGSPRVASALPGLVIYALIDTANIEDGDTIAGWVFWATLS